MNVSLTYAKGWLVAATSSNSTAKSLAYQRLQSPLFILGSAHSGKSLLAQAAVDPTQATVVFGTADPRENALKERVDELKAGRPKHWQTIEDNAHLGERLNKLASDSQQIVIDSINQWVASRLLSGSHRYSLDQLTDIVETEFAQLLKAIHEQRQKRIVIVSSEIAAGISPPHAIPRLYRRLTGVLNCRIAEAAATVLLVSAGIPLILKGGIPPSASK